MGACDVCGKMPCYEHERKTVASKPTLLETIAEIKRLAAEATAGPWKLCKHLRSKEDDESCPCGHRGDIWAGDGERIVLQMECRSQDGHDDLMPPYPVRPETLANAQLIAALRNNADDLLAAAEFGVRAREFLREHGEASGLGSLRAREALYALIAEARNGE